MNISKTPWGIQTLQTERNGYPDWTTYAIRDASNHCLAVVGDVDRATTAQNEANTKLMSTAPELLAACEAVIKWAETPGDHGGNPWCQNFVQAARDAIAKAKGTK